VSPRDVTYLGFSVIGVVAVVLVLVSHWRRSRVPTLSVVFSRLMRKRTTRVALVLAWWWIGFHFFVR
jgi:hypothetical protein